MVSTLNGGQLVVTKDKVPDEVARIIEIVAGDDAVNIHIEEKRNAFIEIRYEYCYAED